LYFLADRTNGRAYATLQFLAYDQTYLQKYLS